MRFSASDQTYFRQGGRQLQVENFQMMDFSGTFLEFTTTASRISANIKSTGFADCETLQAWVAVFIREVPESAINPETKAIDYDAIRGGLMNETVPMKRFKLEPDTTCVYTLYETDKPRTVMARLVRMSEAAFAKMGVEWIEADCDEENKITWPAPTKPVERRIEFVGDSITCGYGNEGVVELDQFTTSQENPVMGYAMTTARKLHAEYNLVSWSGIGVISSWVEETVDEPLDNWLMPYVYKYSEPAYSNDLGIKDPELWDSSRFAPDVIVINLGTNDCSYTRFIEERVQSFGCKYHEFVTYIREHNPNSKIICSLGIMGQDLCDEIERQVENFHSEGDNQIYFYKFDVQSPECGTGADYHPTIASHQKASQGFSEYIRKLMQWDEES